MKNFQYIFTISFLVLTSFLSAQKKTITISGFVSDQKTGEMLIGSNIILYKDEINSANFSRGTATNSYGYYVFPKLEPENYFIVAHYIGYDTYIKEISLSDSTDSYRLNIEMIPHEIELDEVVIQENKPETTEPGTIVISSDLIKNLPSVSGELEIFKSLQYIPGIKALSELSSGLYIRGGSPDQTLTLLDGMIIYNPAHLGNFTSTFNSSALQDIKLIKGAFPAEYGGRLSSVVDIKLRSGTKEKDKGSFGIGAISSNITIEGPMNKNSTYMFSGRGMYYDLLQKNLEKNSSVPRYHFYDINSKFSYSLSNSNIVSISAMLSRDNLYSPANNSDISYDINWQNGAVNLNWLQVTSPSSFTNTTFSFINYEFESLIEAAKSSVSSSDYFASSRLMDFILKKNFEIYWHEKHTLKTGAEIALHSYNLLGTNFYDPALNLDTEVRTKILATEASIYLQNESLLTSFLNTNAGIRFYYFENSKYFSIEPRFSINFILTENLYFKAAYSYANQFLHLLVKNEVPLPSDLWYPSTKNINPAKSTQYVGGIEFHTNDREYLISIEAYYRDMKNIYEFKDNINFNLGVPIEETFTKGEGEAYGIEFFINKRRGKFSGWIGYTLSWTKRLFPELNRGRIFYPRYDRRHDISFVLSYDILLSLSSGLTWTYSSGQGFTLPVGQYIFYNTGVNGNPEIRLNYTARNGHKLPDYHKLDFNLNYKTILFGLESDIYLNIYNLYNRKNSFAQYVTYEDNPDGSGTRIAKLKQINLFPFIPSVGINFKF